MNKYLIMALAGYEKAHNDLIMAIVRIKSYEAKKKFEEVQHTARLKTLELEHEAAKRNADHKAEIVKAAEQALRRTALTHGGKKFLTKKFVINAKKIDNFLMQIRLQEKNIILKDK